MVENPFFLTYHFLTSIFLFLELEYLDLQDNLGIQANVSQIMTSMPNLLYLDVGDRMISGSLPAQSISNIKILRTVGATLTGSLPFEIGTWTNLGKHFASSFLK
jgi:hypothetical protein